MRISLLLLLLISHSFVNAQNTRINFSENSVNSSDFDGDQINCIDKKNSAYSSNDILEPYIIYHDNGQVAEEGLIVNNKPEGIWKKYDRNGKIIGRIKYKDGEKSGKWVVRDHNGKLLAKGRYDHYGMKTGNWIYWSSIEEKYIKGSY